MSIENGMSRRNFLSGAAVAGAAIAGMAGMAGLSACSPAASSSKSDAKADTKAAATGDHDGLRRHGRYALAWREARNCRCRR